MRRLFPLLAFVSLLPVASGAWAQGNSAHPTGSFTPGHPLTSATHSGSPYEDGGGVANPNLSEVGIVGTGLRQCIDDVSPSSPGGYHRLCFGHAADGSALVTVDDLGGSPTTGCNFVINGVTVPCGGTSSTALPMISSNAAVKALAAGYATAIMRLGFTNSSSGPEGVYYWSGTQCSLNGGAGDDGSQIAPTIGTGCWLLAKQQSYDVRQWGVALSNPIHLTVTLAGADTALCGIVSAVPCRTITGAQATANQLNSGGNVIEIDLPANATFTECVSQTGPLIGSATARPNPLTIGTALGPSMLLVKGQGATTVWNGCSSFFYTFQGSNGGQIGIQNLTMQSTGNSSQLSFAVQLGGQAYSMGGITWDQSNNVHAWAQDPGSLLVLMGTDSITGGTSRVSNSFANANGGAAVQILGYGLAWTAPLTSGLTFNDGFFNASNGGQIIDNGPGGHGFVNGITGRALHVSNSGTFVNQTGIAYTTLLPTGSLQSVEYNGGRSIPEPDTVISTPSSGCGSTCTTTLLQQGPRSGTVTLSASGSGIASSGSFNVSLGISLKPPLGSYSSCVPSLNASGSGAWNAGAIVLTTSPTVSSGKEAFTIGWSNNGTNLTTGQTFLISYVCPDGG